MRTRALSAIRASFANPIIRKLVQLAHGNSAEFAQVQSPTLTSMLAIRCVQDTYNRARVYVPHNMHVIAQMCRDRGRALIRCV